MVITIGREFGSGGKYIGERLAEELNLKLYDKEFSFRSNMGILKSEYIKSGFYKDFDKYYSEDIIKGKIQNKYYFLLFCQY